VERRDLSSQERTEGEKRGDKVAWHRWFTDCKEGIILHSIKPVALLCLWVLIFSRVANFNSQAGLLKLF